MDAGQPAWVCPYCDATQVSPCPDASVRRPAVVVRRCAACRSEVQITVTVVRHRASQVIKDGGQ